MKILLLVLLAFSYSYSFKIEDGFNIYKYRPPYIIKSKLEKNTNLYLFGTSHTDGTKHSKGIKNPVYQSIEKLLQIYDIDYIIIEGIAHIPRVVKGYIKRGIKECTLDKKVCHQEQSYMVSVALSKDSSIVIQGGEPTYAEQLEYFKRHNYNIKDLIGVWTLKKARKGISIKAFKRKLESVRKSFVKVNQNKKIKFSYIDFKEWYRDKIGKKFTIKSSDIQIDSRKYYNPYDKNDANSIKKINSYFLNHGIRDISLVKEIDKAVRAGYKNIVVLYGSSHIRNIYKIYSNKNSYFMKWY